MFEYRLVIWFALFIWWLKNNINTTLILESVLQQYGGLVMISDGHITHSCTALVPYLYIVTGSLDSNVNINLPVIYYNNSTQNVLKTWGRSGHTVSLVGARISSIIMLSLVKELRLRVLDLSELKERRLLAFIVIPYSAGGIENEIHTKHTRT